MRRDVLSPGVLAGVDATDVDAEVKAGVLAGDEVKLDSQPLEDEEGAESLDVEGVRSMKLVVAARFGIGMPWRNLDTSQVFLRSGALGLSGTAGAGSGSFLSSELPLRPTIHHIPEGLLSTLTGSVFCGSISPVHGVSIDYCNEIEGVETYSPYSASRP